MKKLIFMLLFACVSLLPMMARETGEGEAAGEQFVLSAAMFGNGGDVLAVNPDSVPVAGIEATLAEIAGVTKLKTDEALRLVEDRVMRGTSFPMGKFLEALSLRGA